MYPRGIQLRNLSRVSKVTATSGTFCELSITNWQSWKICENSLHIVSFRCFAFVCVICPLEKSKTSSDKSFKMAMLFWQRLSFVLLAPTISPMNDSQFFGHSRFRTWKKIKPNVWFGLTKPFEIVVFQFFLKLIYLHENHVEFVQVDFGSLHGFRVAARFDNQAYDILFYPLTLVSR